MIGEGIKQIPSYICTIPYDQLNSLREKFWKSRKTFKKVWKAIREICESDHETALLLMEAAEMSCVKNDLREIIVVENPDIIFRVPNFCICDPVFERDYKSLKEKSQNVEEKKIKIIIFYLEQNKNIELDVTNKTKVLDVKKIVAKKLGINFDKYKIRLLFSGQELLDDNLLCYNNIEDNSKIHVMINEK